MTIASASIPYSAYSSGWRPGLPEAVDPERDGAAAAESGADERERVARTVDNRDDGQPLLVRPEQRLEV